VTQARKVLMVCMGNICRSPTAEGVLRHKLHEAGLHDLVVVDSAGTHAYHVGDPPDNRSMQHARRRGYDLSALRARRVADADFERFDLILAMDWDNYALLEEQCPPQHRA
jgi:protein-tyrosine phosphatase